MEKLFKFREFNGHHIDALVKNQLWFSTGSSFNDPFDCSVHLPMTWASEASLVNYIIHETDTTSKLLRCGCSHNTVAKIIKDTVSDVIANPSIFDGESAEYFRQLLFGNLQSALVLCLSQDATNNLMWSHYAAWHTGFCIEFNSTKLLQCLDLYHHAEVNYNSQPYDVLSNLKATAHDRLHPAKQICFMKSPEWRYEREYRLIHKKLSQKEVHSTPVSYDPNCVESIYFGMKAKQDSIQDLCEKLKGRGISFFKMRPELSGTKFKLEPVQLINCSRVIHNA
ncbi:DUF2971 domain-containing protein [Vibrio cholerae]|uniref:DUF2971 domain-containing protein n=1 Tax=Vibrio cholerae TaxID=666 RepID=UPI0029521EAF|nr:DUF2971 domain-containing protein [Vibrio cholerae]EIC9802240.1 DUF2971 domain-containing protein [Vibrio cholerae]EIJ0935765.1 DUF2971 domain-containing protein [Vibrio cholerae]ELS9246538.1 DUF2971 domain-containing protein [Vibrio cholerae]MEB3763899.1 DUF2971 domain-containing protein [Vibrio cholerae]